MIEIEEGKEIKELEPSFDFFPDIKLTKKEKIYQEKLQKRDLLKDSIKFLADLTGSGVVYGQNGDLQFQSLFTDDLNKLELEKQVKILSLHFVKQTLELCQN